MGRKPKELPGEDSPLVGLANWLREQRERSGLTYTELAERLDYNKSTLSRAVSGTELPSLAVVERFTMACGGDLKTARRLHWQCLREFRVKRMLQEEAPIHRDKVITPTDLWSALVGTYALSGLSYRSAEEKAKRLHEQGILAQPIGRSSFHNFVKRSTPLTRTIMLAVIAVSDVPQSEWPLWESAWRNARLEFVRAAAREGSPAGEEFLRQQREHLPKIWGLPWNN
ncbi:helix-turn-helix domain-containing protein [Streptomyces luteogriseus]|uniref:helix-turn-helix domain-containing protein n=1 Tax=Streptomyces luteogriseus TaxID=68233 RepID=UPI003791FDF4